MDMVKKIFWKIKGSPPFPPFKRAPRGKWRQWPNFFILKFNYVSKKRMFAKKYIQEYWVLTKWRILLCGDNFFWVECRKFRIRAVVSEDNVNVAIIALNQFFFFWGPRKRGKNFHMIFRLNNWLTEPFTSNLLRKT